MEDYTCYYKFASAKDYESISIDWHYTMFSDLKESIFKKKCSGKVNSRRQPSDDLIVTNAQTNEVYVKGDALIPKHTHVVVRRVPAVCYPPIIFDKPPEENKLEDENSSYEEDSSSTTGLYITDSEWEEFFNDLSTPKVVPDAPPSKADKDSKIRALIDTPGAAGRGFGRGMVGRSDRGGFGRGGLLERVTPPTGYICHRCKVPGHFIQHCPTNGIPKSMLMATPDGSSALPRLADAVSTKPKVAVIPKELYCPLCKALMKDAVVGKCCFNSFCDKCIRDYIMSKSLCLCGARNVLADNLIPNKTLRGTIVWYLESNKGGGANGGSACQPNDMESAQCSKQKQDLERSGGSMEVSRDGDFSRDLPPSLPSKSSTNKTLSDQKNNATVSACITSPEWESAASKKRKLDGSCPAVNGASHHSSHMATSNGYCVDYCKIAAAVSKKSFNFADDRDDELSDDDRHFKRRRSRYESSPASAVVDVRHSNRGSREKGVIGASIGVLSVY